MQVSIYSRAAMDRLLQNGFPENTAIISFSSPGSQALTFAGLGQERIFSVVIPDIDLQILGDYGYTYDSYLAEADALAAFIYKAKAGGNALICQCDYGQSRSAACAAAILQHFEKRGIDIFSDYRYYPNQVVYHKVLDALEKHRLALR